MESLGRPFPSASVSHNSRNRNISFNLAPLYILCKWTIPIVAQKEEQSWNKPLMLIQSVLFPWSFYLLLKQYDPELADFGPLNRAVIPAILSVVFFACKYFFFSNFFILYFNGNSVVFLTTMRLPLNQPPKWYFLSTIVGFLGCIVWIYVIATGNVSAILISIFTFLIRQHSGRACRRSHLSRVLLEHQQCCDGPLAAVVGEFHRRFRR